MLFDDVAAWLAPSRPRFCRPLEREGSLLASFCAERGEGSEAVSRPWPSWPCPLSAGAYMAAGRDVEFPRPDCPSCAGPLVFWSGYRRHVRAAGRCQKIFVPRLRCRRCEVSHALLPAFVLAWRLDVAEAVGAVIGQVAGGACGVRPAAGPDGCPSYDRARVGAAVPGARPGTRGDVRGAGRRAGRAGNRPCGAGRPFRAGRDHRSVRRGHRPAGRAGGGAVAVRVVGERREADRGQHNLALVDRRPTG